MKIPEPALYHRGCCCVGMFGNAHQLINPVELVNLLAEVQHVSTQMNTPCSVVSLDITDCNYKICSGKNAFTEIKLVKKSMPSKCQESE